MQKGASSHGREKLHLLLSMLLSHLFPWRHLWESKNRKGTDLRCASKDLTWWKIPNQNLVWSNEIFLEFYDVFIRNMSRRHESTLRKVWDNFKTSTNSVEWNFWKTHIDQHPRTHQHHMNGSWNLVNKRVTKRKNHPFTCSCKLWN